MILKPMIRGRTFLGNLVLISGQVAATALMACGTTTTRISPRSTINFPVPWSQTGPALTKGALEAPAPSSPTGRSSPGEQPGSRRLAVLEFQGRNLDPDILMTFSDAVRGGALTGVAGGGFSVITRENMLVLLKDMGKDECTEGDCEVETARNIGADYVVSGKVVRMEDVYVVTLKLHETRRGTLLGTDSVEAKTQIQLLRILSEHARKMVVSSFDGSMSER